MANRENKAYPKLKRLALLTSSCRWAAHMLEHQSRQPADRRRSLLIEALNLKSTTIPLATFGLLCLLAALSSGCQAEPSTLTPTIVPPGELDKSASGIDHETSLLRAPFADRTIAGRAIRFYTIEALDSFKELDEVEITPGINSGWAEQHGAPIPSGESLASLIISSSPVPPDSPQLEAWHYAPWYNASFVLQQRKWTLDMYLGGLGFLTDSSGKTAAFLWTQVEDGGEPTDTRGASAPSSLKSENGAIHLDPAACAIPTLTLMSLRR